MKLLDIVTLFNEKKVKFFFYKTFYRGMYNLYFTPTIYFRRAISYKNGHKYGYGLYVSWLFWEFSIEIK